MPKTIHTPRDELICGKIDAALVHARDVKFIDLLEDIRNDAARMEAALVRRKDEVEALEEKSKQEPDWWYCDIDPDESGDSAYEAMFHHRPRLEPVELHSSFVGPRKWGVMHPSTEDDGEEATTFDTKEEAQTFCDSIRALANKPKEGE